MNLINFMKLLYNQTLVKACEIDYEDGPIDSKYQLIHTRAWFFKNLQENLKHPAIICMSMGDNGLTNNNYYAINRWFEKPIYSFNQFNANIKKLYCTHANLKDSLVEGVPCGIMFSVTSNVSFLEQVEKEVIPKTKLLYLKFKPETHPCRSNLLLYFSKQNWTTTETNDLTIQKRYFSVMKQHKWILCPPGHGPDSYRVWEALYMKSYPIVLKGCHHYFNDLPILEVDSFYSLSEEFLENKWEEWQDREWNWASLEEEYWINRVKTKALSVSNG